MRLVRCSFMHCICVFSFFSIIIVYIFITLKDKVFHTHTCTLSQYHFVNGKEKHTAFCQNPLFYLYKRNKDQIYLFVFMVLLVSFQYVLLSVLFIFICILRLIIAMRAEAVKLPHSVFRTANHY